MTRTLTEKEEVLLQACLDEAGCNDLSRLVEFIRDAQTDACVVEFSDPILVEMEFPKPEGKLGSVFVHVVNFFEKHAHETGGYPKYPNQLGETSVAMGVGAAMGVSTATTKKKIRQLGALGWFVMKHRSIQNPVATYEMAYKHNTPHPSFKRVSNLGMCYNEVRAINEAKRAAAEMDEEE